MPREKRYYVYIMASKGRVLYVGVTGFLFSRVMQHKSGEIDGFTSAITSIDSCTTSRSSTSTEPSNVKPKLRIGDERRKSL
jgi:predicted GIY-YIG superfamily endonuclease